MAEKETKKVAVVSGDLTIDWNIATFQDLAGEMQTKYWATGFSSRAYCQSGGAAVVADLVSSVAKSLPHEKKYEVLPIIPPGQEVSPCDDHFHHAYTMWAPHKFCEKPPLDREK